MQDPDALREEVTRLQGRLDAAELEPERAHRLLDGWGLPREANPDARGAGQPLELSLSGRLELLPDGEPEP